MCDGDELQAVDEQRLLQLVRHAHFVAAVLFTQLVAADAHELDRVRPVVGAGAFPIPHFTAAHEIGDELEALAVPGVEERARRRFPVQLFDVDGVRERNRCDRNR